MFQPCQRDVQPLLALALCGLLVLPITARAKSVDGEFGADLNALGSFYTSPGEGESNHYIDMWGHGSLPHFLASQGLTNNRTLFVISHGKGIITNRAKRYAYYPDQRVWPDKAVSYFSAADLAAVVGTAAGDIHNVVVAGCNLEGAFDSAEIRRHFPNATNVTHTPAGKNGYELVYRHSLIHPSSGVRLLYDSSSRLKTGDLIASSCARRLGFAPYVAQLYAAGGVRPYKTQVAGRELLDPGLPLPKRPELEKLVRESAEELATAAALKGHDDLVRWPSRSDMTLGRTHRAAYIDSHADHRRDSSRVAPQSP